MRKEEVVYINPSEKKMNDNRYIPFEDVRKMFQSGELWEKDMQTLNRCLRGLVAEAEQNEYIRHHYTIIAAAIQNILLERIIAKIDRRNTILTCVLIGIAIVTVAFAIF